MVFKDNKMEQMKWKHVYILFRIQSQVINKLVAVRRHIRDCQMIPKSLKDLA